MATTVVSFNPTSISFKTLLKCERAFGVKVLPLIAKLEKMDDGFDISVLSMEEMATLTMLALDMQGQKELTADDILELDITSMQESLLTLGSVEVTQEDPS